MEDLIYKFLSDTISKAELEKLQKWLQNDDNKAAFEVHVRDAYAVNMLYNDVDIEHALKKVLDNLETPYRVIPLYKRSIFKYAAAILIFISTGIFFLTKKDTQTVEPIIVNNTIKVGTNKAILTLEDGTDVTLEKEQGYIAENLESNGEEIIYKLTNNSNQDIAYNYLTIPRGGQYYIKLSDGTEVWLNSESKLKYPVAFQEGETRQVELIYGEAYFDVSPSTLHKGSKFKVLSNAQEVEVLGTEFNIKAYKDEASTYTTLVEGKVAVSNTLNSGVLVPGQQSIIEKDNDHIEIINVDVYDEIAWKDGIFSFKNKPLKAIAKVLSRWYDMDVIFLDKSLETVKFKGVLGKDQPIEEILSAIKSVSINNYEINNKTIIIK